MKFVVRKNKKLAFKSFAIRIKEEKTRHSAAFDFMKIPTKIIAAGSDFRRYVKTGDKDLMDKALVILEKFFNKIWKEKQRELNSVLRKLTDFTLYERWLSREIPRQTGRTWPYREIIFYPSFLAWSASTKNTIRVGIAPKHFLEKDFIGVLIHELIHVNTHAIKTKSKLKYAVDSKEIADTIVVNRIIDSMHKRFGVKLRPLRQANPFKRYRSDFLNLKKLAGQANGIVAITRRVDRYLTRKQHREVYIP